MKTDLKELEIEDITVKVGDTVKVKDDPTNEVGIVKKIESSGYFDPRKKYDLIIDWEGCTSNGVRTPMNYFYKTMEVVTS